MAITAYLCPLCQTVTFRKSKRCKQPQCPGRPCKLGAKKQSKYRARPVTINGEFFASVKEASRWQELLLLQQAGKISGLRRQVVFRLHALGGQEVTSYRADAVYTEELSGEYIVEDAKGVKTDMYSLKKKWLLAEYDLAIKEV